MAGDRPTLNNTAPVSARHNVIMRWLGAEGRVDVVDAANRLGVAQETVRRDLRILENSGRLQRVHGGALPVEEHPFRDLAPPLASDGSHLAFARVVWAHLPRRGTMLFGAGRLTLALAQVINAYPPTGSGLTVVTNSLDIAIALAPIRLDRKSTRLNSSHANISYAVFCLKKKKKKQHPSKRSKKQPTHKHQ